MSQSSRRLLSPVSPRITRPAPLFVHRNVQLVKGDPFLALYIVERTSKPYSEVLPIVADSYILPVKVGDNRR
uniref:Uncharacterized protein n=1 Tax=Romanomermis culicivorax TaxID=13658 RepID=A0A915JF89_ROMCU